MVTLVNRSKGAELVQSAHVENLEEEEGSGDDSTADCNNDELLKHFREVKLGVEDFVFRKWV